MSKGSGLAALLLFALAACSAPSARPAGLATPRPSATTRGPAPSPPPPTVVIGELVERDLDAELEEAYAARHAHGATAASVATLLALRRIAEQRSDQRAVVGSAGDYIARLPSGLRVLTGSAPIVLDAAGEPVGWFALGDVRDRQRCPPCGPHDRTLVAAPFGDELAVLSPQGYVSGALLIDISSMRRIESLPGNLASMAIGPDGLLAWADLSFEGDVCRGRVGLSTRRGGRRWTPSFAALPELCQSVLELGWRGSQQVAIVQRDLGKAMLVSIDDAAPSTIPLPRPAKATLKHASRPLCGADRAPVKSRGCTVGGRWVFPTDACAGAQPFADDPGVACDPNAPPLP